jgi:hypothetical protein
MSDNISLSEAQSRFLSILLENKFVTMYLIGPAGYGKTFVIREGIRLLKEQNPDIKISITAMSSVAADVIGEVCGIRATTLHTWWGIGKDSLRLHDEKHLRGVLNPRKHTNPLTTHILFIDEVSMLSVQILEVMDKVLRWYRKNPNERFGGMKVVLIGDPMQLPPIPAQAGPGLYRDTALVTESCLSLTDDHKNTEYVVLNDPQRCRDKSFQIMLRGLIHQDMDVRRRAMAVFDNHYVPGYETIASVVRSAKETGAMIIAHTNELVALFNAEVCYHLQSRGRPRHRFEVWFRDFTDDQIVSIPDEDGPDVIRDHLNREERAITEDRKRFFPGGWLYEGQLVQIRANHETVNGKLARVGDVCEFTGCDDKGNAILIRKKDGAELVVGLYHAQSEYWSELKWKGYPFICADASTVHLLQGCTVPGKLIFWTDINGDIFGNIPFYLQVAASRVTVPSNFITTHTLGVHRLVSRDVGETLKSIWKLDFMKSYPTA